MKNSQVFKYSGKIIKTPDFLVPWIPEIKFIDPKFGLPLYLNGQKIEMTQYNSSQDEYGQDGARTGGQFYTEAMRHTDESEHELRLSCFQAAEIFYLQGAYFGTNWCFEGLGYIYSYNRCESRNLIRTIDYLNCMYNNWKAGNLMEHLLPYEAKAQYIYDQFKAGNICVELAEIMQDAPNHFIDVDPEKIKEDTNKWAFAAYEFAAGLGYPESCYKLGDMYKNGRGCERDYDKAFQLYKKSYEISKSYEEVLWGSAAFRLAMAYENGQGCKQNFAKALEYYEIASTGLEIAVDSGEWFYKKVLRDAQEGVLRCKQELAGNY
ncbi:MAG: sel1 repeat family protein [Coriobacteriales bacterium]|nr:sel1 repeat family protein [Coriobacteriales bacterium]